MDLIKMYSIEVFRWCSSLAALVLTIINLWTVNDSNLYPATLIN